MSHLLILVVTPCLGLFLWEHLGNETSRPSTFMTAAATRLATFSAWLGVQWARLSNFITWLQLYEIGQTLVRLGAATTNLVTGPFEAGRQAYWHYVHASQFPRLVAAGSVLLFIAFEAILIVCFILPRLSFGENLFALNCVLIFVPIAVTAISFNETHPKNNTPQPPRPDTPRPNYGFDRQ